MAGAALSIDVKDKEFKDLMRGLAKRTKDLSPVMKVIGEIVRSSVVRNFEQGGRPEKWQPHSMATVFGSLRKRDYTKKGKLRAGASRRLQKGKVLIKTDRLMKSVNYRASQTRVDIGTNVVYAAIHQFGGKAGRGRKVTIPARPFLAIQDEDWKEMREAIAGYITKGAR